MKAAHRHELKTNELAEWIANLPGWAKENLKMIIIVSVVAVLAVGSYFYFRYQRNAVSVREQLRLTEFVTRLLQSKRDILGAQARGADVSFVLLQLADRLQAFAQNAKDDQRAAFALIKRAEALRAELHYRPRTVSRRDLTTQIERAKKSYNEALERSSSNQSLVAVAKFGLGLCEEELGSFDKARKIYRDIAGNPEFQGTVTVAQAKQRLETMADYQQKVVFRVLPRPKPPTVVEVPVPLRPPDINLAAVNLPAVNIAVPKPLPALPEPNKGPLGVPPADINLVDTNLAGPR